MDYSDFTNDSPAVAPPGAQYATTTCTGVDPQTCITEYPPNFYVQDRGNVSWGLAVIITILSFAFILYIYNLFSRKKPVV